MQRIKEIYYMLTYSILLIALGVLMTLFYFEFNKGGFIVEDCSTQANIQGLWLPDIKELAKYSGKYICINLKEVNDLKELERVCKHEIGHEVFARTCESNFNKCLEVGNES